MRVRDSAEGPNWTTDASLEGEGAGLGAFTPPTLPSPVAQETQTPPALPLPPPARLRWTWCGSAGPAASARRASGGASIGRSSLPSGSAVSKGMVMGVGREEDGVVACVRV